MKRKDLERILKENGFVLERNGANHDIFSDGNKSIPVPRHKEIREKTTKDILKEAGIG